MPLKGHVLFKPIKKIVYSQNRIPLRKILLYSFYNIYVLVNDPLRHQPLPSSKECSHATGYWLLAIVLLKQARPKVYSWADFDYLFHASL